MVAFVITGDTVNLTIKGKMETLHKTHKNYEKVLELLKGNVTEEKLLELMNPGKVIENFGEGTLSVKDGIVFYKDGKEEIMVDNSLIKRITTMAKEGFTVKPLVAFFDNLMLNPSAQAVQGLYSFLEKNELPITDDGFFLAYKRVRHSFMDIYSNTMDNSVGKTIKVMRNQVDDNSSKTCSFGLHFASFDYAANQYGSWDRDDRLLMVKVNPKDVVAFPGDYRHAKGRTCEYEVMQELALDGFEHINDHIVKMSSVERLRNIIEDIRKIISFETPKAKEGEKEIDFRLGDYLSNHFNNAKIRKIILAVKQKFNITEDFAFDDLSSVSIQTLITFIGNEAEEI